MVADTMLDYSTMIDDAMRGVVRIALQKVLKHGLPSDHHFFISFNTNYTGTKISPQLHQRFPEEMTIVLQHQFWDLQVHDDYFSVMLSFNNIPEKLVIPYAALIAFADPSVKFGLQFHHKSEAHHVMPVNRSSVEAEASFDFVGTDEDERDGAQKEQIAEVISLDAFRKK